MLVKKRLNLLTTHIECLEQALGKLPETLSCRYNPGGVFQMSNGIMDNPGDAKYGMTREQILANWDGQLAKGKAFKADTLEEVIDALGLPRETAAVFFPYYG